MKIRKVKVCHMSEVLDGLTDEFKEAFSDEIGRKFTWGDCNRSLVNRQNLLSVIMSEASVEMTDTHDYNHVAISLVTSRVKSLPENTYIDLEN